MLLYVTVYGVDAMNIWSFDDKHLRDAIKKGNVLLKKDKISEARKDIISYEISIFNNWLNGNFDYVCRFDDKKSSYSTGDDIDYKKMIMHDAKVCGSSFGNGYISLISKLVDNGVFLIPKCHDEHIDLDEQVDILMKTYESSSPFFYESAKKIILPGNKHIQLINDDNILSYSFSSTEILDESFIISNPNEGNGILSYYVQEGIENLLPLGYSFDYIELGPILFQILFHDKLYEEKGIKYSTDYYELIDGFNKKIIDVLPILKLYQVTRSSKEDEITDEMFSDLCYRYFGTDNLKFVYNMIHKIVESNDIEFIFSVIYALDTRDKIINNKSDAHDVLSYLNDDYLYTTKSIDYKYTVYQKYMNEVNNRCK